MPAAARVADDRRLRAGPLLHGRRRGVAATDPHLERHRPPRDGTARSAEARRVLRRVGRPLRPRCLGAYCAGGGKELRVYVDGKRERGDPRRIVLRDGEEIAVVFGGRGDFARSRRRYGKRMPGGCGGPGERTCFPGMNRGRPTTKQAHDRPGRRLRFVLAGLAALACLCAGSASAGVAAQPFTVTSTLHGKTVLPHRIHWYATTNLPENKVLDVKFLVDGKALWTEASAPYIYGDPEETFGKANRGYLGRRSSRRGGTSSRCARRRSTGRRRPTRSSRRCRPRPRRPPGSRGRGGARSTTSRACPRPGRPATRQAATRPRAGTRW